MKNWKREKKTIAAIFIIVFILVIVFFIVLRMSSSTTSPIVIERNSYGEGEKEAAVYLEDGEELHFTVGEREYTEEELEKAFSEGFRWAREQMLLENVSVAEVRTDLNFMTDVPGGLLAEWVPCETELIDADGTLCNENMDAAEEQQVRVSLYLSYGEEVRMEDIYLVVKGPLFSEEESLRQKILTAIEGVEQNSREKDSFSLPASIEGVKLLAQPKTNPVGILFLILPVIVFVPLHRKNKEKEKQLERQRQLVEEYPTVVNKLVLYLGAGLNLKSAFQLLLEDERDVKNDGTPGYLKEELTVMLNEIKAGVSERVAYEAFGRRTKENCYIRLMALLVQNYQKGNEGLLKVLAQEEEDAFLERMDRAKKAGEEAGTKLLFPMLLLLVVVMVIVMAPAVIQFQNY